MAGKKTFSLKWQLIILVISCWLIPIAAVAGIFGNLLSRSVRESLEQEIETVVQNAVSQMDIRLSAAIEDSKGVSYDGIVRSSYRTYQLNGDKAELYRSTNEYLNQRFSKDEKYQAVFISFLNDVDIDSYVITSNISEYSTLQNYRKFIQPALSRVMENEDTAIRFLVIDGELYMVRNLLDGRFVPYATVVMMCRKDALFRSFFDSPRNLMTEIVLDGETVFSALPAVGNGEDYHYTTQESTVDGHTVSVTTAFEKFNLWQDVPSLKYGILAATGLVIPVLLIAFLYFYRQVTKPTNTLLKAHEKVRAGERGYTISEMPGNEEFRQLTTEFNAMSRELKSQFDQIYLEQQAAQQAKIKTLQSQINPHFLNNTLEVINWEARMADNDKVSAMIEALSTMLDAALDRDNKGMIPLHQELGYVDAYLYIIHERLGDHFRFSKEIDADLENVMIPRLILQPIVENAVEHDITPRGSGMIQIHVYRENSFIYLETIHSGTLTEEDRLNIVRMIENADALDGVKVGLRNVAQRLRLIYGDRANITFSENDHLITIRLGIPE